MGNIQSTAFRSGQLFSGSQTVTGEVMMMFFAIIIILALIFKEKHRLAFTGFNACVLLIFLLMFAVDFVGQFQDMPVVVSFSAGVLFMASLLIELALFADRVHILYVIRVKTHFTPLSKKTRIFALILMLILFLVMINAFVGFSLGSFSNVWSTSSETTYIYNVLLCCILLGQSLGSFELMRYSRKLSLKRYVSPKSRLELELQKNVSGFHQCCMTTFGKAILLACHVIASLHGIDTLFLLKASCFVVATLGSFMSRGGFSCLACKRATKIETFSPEQATSRKTNVTRTGNGGETARAVYSVSVVELQNNNLVQMP